VLPLDVTAWIDSNAGWIGFGGFVLAIVFGVLSFYFWRRPHRSKMLGCERISGYSLVRVAANPGDRHPLKLVYGSHDVTAPYISVLRVGNMGDEEVRADDFDLPITIDFPKGKLLAYDVIDKSKPEIEPVFTVDTAHPNRITLKPLLLNGHEWIDIQCVSDGGPGIPEVKSRVAGETKTMVGMMDRAEKARRHRTWSLTVIVIGTFGLIGLSLFTTYQFPDQNMLPIVALGAGYLLGSSSLWNQTRATKHPAWEKKQT
jgi:hypothetical protein